jgi:hypothetical protein
MVGFLLFFCNGQEPMGKNPMDDEYNSLYETAEEKYRQSFITVLEYME